MDTYFTDGKNMKNINSLPPEAWRYLSGAQEDDKGLKKLQKTVPWLYRGLQIRMNSVASVPFAIMDGENVYDSSDNWQNKLGWLPNPRRVFMLAEGGLTLFGKSYFFQKPNMLNEPMELRYWFPMSVREKITQENGLEYFSRSLSDTSQDYAVEDVLYIWGVDPYVEIGPPLGSPATAAIAGAGVLWNVDDFAAAFFSRGAIKATILSVPQGTIESERNRLKLWWQRAIQGKNFATEVVNSDAVQATTIGEGIKELENVELTKEKREDISTALGIPQSKMFSTSSTDSNREEDERSVIEDMTVPECRLLEEAFNEQILGPQGLRLKFTPEAMSVYQEDEQMRSTAFLNYVNALGKDKASIAAKFLGIEMPDGLDYADLDTEPMPVPDFTPKEEKDEEDDQKQEEKSQFARWAKKRSPDEWHKFEFHYLDEVEQVQLLGERAPSDNHDELVKALTGVIDELRSGKEQPSINVYNQLPGTKIEIPEREVVVNVPEQKAEFKAEVNVPETQVNVSAPQVTVQNAVEPTPVTIENEIKIQSKERTTKVKRDARGQITEMKTE